MASLVDTVAVTQAYANSIPLPCAVLALSVAVCVGASSDAGALSLRGGYRAEVQQREAFEQLLQAIHQVAKGLDEKLDGRASDTVRKLLRPSWVFTCVAPDMSLMPGPIHLREALLNLPPPTL